MLWNWIKSEILYVKDVLKETSTLKSSTDLFDKFAKELTGYVNIDW